MKDYYYNLSEADIAAVRGYYAGKVLLSSIEEEGVRVAEKFQLCMRCFADTKEEEYKSILYRAGSQFRPMVEDYVFGIGKLEDIRLWLGDALASAIEEFKIKYVLIE